MAERGLTRPAEMNGGDSRRDMLQQHHRQTLWVPWTVILLGVWLLLSPSAFGYGNPDLWTVPSGGRGAWFSNQTFDSLRADLMIWSDVVSGAALVILGWRALTPDRPVSRWAACLVGVWLVFAPVVLWAPTAAAFVNDSLVGILVIALTILIPGMPNMPMYMVHGGDTPPGWSYNPSSWPQRAILIGLGFAGLVVSRYLAAYQMGYVDVLWDPFFGWSTGTQQVLDSDMSHMWPVSDAGLGAVAYTFEFLMGYMGGTARWRTMPWMVTIFGILVIPLGLAHITLVMSQAVVVHSWCTFCLLAAAIMLPMIPLEVDEVVAMGQHLKQAKRRGDRGGSLWKVFWMGGGSDDTTDDERSPGFVTVHERPGPVIRAAVWGFTVPRNLAVVTAIGLFLLFAPVVFGVGIQSSAADVAHIGGAAVVVVAVTAMGEVLRTVRYLNVAIGPGIAAVALLTGGDIGYTITLVAAGLAVAALSIAGKAVRERYGAWQGVIR